MDTVLRVNDDRTAMVAIASAQSAHVVLSDTTPFVEVIDAAPAKQVRFGTSGDGPGEFRSPSGVATIGDSVAVWDPSSGRLSVIDRTGKLLRAQSVPAAMGKIAGRMLRDGYGNAGRIAVTPSGLVIARYAGSVRQPAGLWAIALVRIRPEGALDTLSVGFPSLALLRELNRDAQELVAVPLWASCGSAGLATWDPVAGLLRRQTDMDAPLRSAAIRGAVTPLTDALIRLNLRYQLTALLAAKRPEPAVFDQMVESMLEQSRNPKSMFPPHAPAFVSMQCDAGGTVWLQQFSLADAGSGMGRTWTVVDSAGAVREVRLPADLRVLGVEDGAVWGVRNGDDGQLLLVQLALPRP
jgi:hypothetical protein